MKPRIAVASSDGKVVNKHFGNTNKFLVFEVDNKGVNFIEVRDATPCCSFGEHSEISLKKTIELISDCKAVVASQIGGGAAEMLAQKGIRAFIERDFIPEALNRVISSNRFKYLLKKLEKEIT
ncbi:hypothetical protein CPJCM30710_28090 [Clostridium polyendosporum]|uniref:Dinitrogenase iron-molybdenum cofactor biosynthesis domain-containing protein n=1 Tax=Clostridium polyendosporum TaxID=69208 RepID=A0A919S3W5_9CLOT|nr:NifB/NifX family molybdenum-iron cluster-binding protein [Clostridium polyendosporum]GIM30143.1 hypothetical protein CPJCM30710_28090 [Clostridium polyendosporum]